jgi:hypothetical protein
MSTRELHAERDRLAAPLAECPPDRSRELRLAAQRATEAERARQQARTDHQAASQQVAALAGSWRRRRELPAAKERRVLAEHTVATTTGQADQAAERLGVLRRVQQRHLGWMEAHDTPSCGSRSARAHPGAWLAWQGRPAGAGAGPAGLVAGRTRPRAHRPAGAWGVARGRRGTGRLPAHLRPGPPRAGRACWGQGGPGWSGGCTAHGPDRRACRRNRRAAGAPRPWRAHPSPRRPRAAADHGRPWAPGRPAAAAGRRTPPIGAWPPPRLAGRPGRPGAPGRLGPPPRPARPAASQPRTTRPHPRPRPQPPGTRRPLGLLGSRDL